MGTPAKFASPIAATSQLFRNFDVNVRPCCSCNEIFRRSKDVLCVIRGGRGNFEQYPAIGTGSLIVDPSEEIRRARYILQCEIKEQFLANFPLREPSRIDASYAALFFTRLLGDRKVVDVPFKGAVVQQVASKPCRAIDSGLNL
jgi:hypothetical protein